MITNDTFSHLILPTLALMLISLATYTRYSRASMLEVLNQDYIRTARAKGLTERTVVVRHAFRNAMIPLATVVAIDIGAILGGAVVTETVFEWNAMGRLFSDGLADPGPEPGDGVLRRGRASSPSSSTCWPTSPTPCSTRASGWATEEVLVMAIIDAPDPLHSPGAAPTDAVDEATAEQQEVVGLSQGQIVRRRFVRHKGAMISLIVLALIIALGSDEHRVGSDPGMVEVGLQGPRPEHHRAGTDAVAPADVARR